MHWLYQLYSIARKSYPAPVAELINEATDSSNHPTLLALTHSLDAGVCRVYCIPVLQQTDWLRQRLQGVRCKAPTGYVAVSGAGASAATNCLLTLVVICYTPSIAAKGWCHIMDLRS
jgi:hypothetical protein